MLPPIVLINGQPVGGNAAEAAQKFLDGTFSDCVVSFNENTIGTLYDSLLINPAGKQIKLSSKGGVGAMASSVNLIKSVRELEAAGMTQFRETYAEAIAILEVIDKTINTNRYGQVRYNERQFDIIPGIGLSRIIVQKGEELKQEIRNQYGDELAELEKKIDIIRNIKNQDYSKQSELISPYFFDESFMKEIVIKDPLILDGLSVRLIIDQGINWENGFNKLATHAINTPYTNTNFEHLIYCMTNGFPKYGDYEHDQVRISNQGHEYNRNELNEILKQHYKRNLILDL
jgi:hypothetical protein